MRRAVRERFRRHRARELGQVGLADEHEPRGAEALGEPRVGLLVPVEVLQHLHTAMERITGRVAHAVLHEERHAPERSGRELGGGRGGERLVVETMDDRVELRIELLDARDRPLDQLGRRHVAAPYRLGLRRGVHPREVVGHSAILSRLTPNICSLN